jgi:phosphonate transport system substrate-binding protein
VEERSPTAPVRFAFSSRMFSEVNENDARAAMKAWGQTISTERGIPLEPVFQIFDGTKAIAAAIRSKLIDAITLPTDEYWALRDEISLGSVIIGSKDGRSTEEYVLLVRGDSGIQRLAPAWLETELLQHQLGLTEQFWGRITESTKLLRAILPVFFHQADACLVTLKGFETMAELNPQIGRQLQILAKSGAMVPNLFCFRGDYVSPNRERILHEISRVGDTAAGQQTLALFQTDRLFPGDPAALASAFALLDLHRQLRTAALNAPPSDSASPPGTSTSGRN